MFTDITPDPGLVPYCIVPEDAITLPDVLFPDTVNDVKVPVLVMFGCAAVVTVPAVVAVATVPLILAATTFDKPPASPVNTPVFAVNATAVTVPLTPNALNVPNDVMFGCDAVASVPATLSALNVFVD